MNDPTQAIASLPAPAARMLAVDILLADPEALADDVLESCLYLCATKHADALPAERVEIGGTSLDLMAYSAS
jgi:hypothetical protein